MNIFARLEEISRTQNLGFLVIGGHAVNAHGYGRATEDADVLILKADAQKRLSALKTDGYSVKHDGGHFLQLESSMAEADPVDFMLVNDSTLLKMKADAKGVQIDQVQVLVPALDHLLALKIHALKNGRPSRNLKDLMDILTLIRVNNIDVHSDKVRLLCDKYGDRKIYDQIVAFGQI